MRRAPSPSASMGWSTRRVRIEVAAKVAKAAKSTKPATHVQRRPWVARASASDASSQSVPSGQRPTERMRYEVPLTSTRPASAASAHRTPAAPAESVV